MDMLDLAIVGGGPGGLMSAWYLKKKLGDLCRITIYEASNRVTRQRSPSFFFRYQALISPPGPPPTIARSNMFHSAASAAPCRKRASKSTLAKALSILKER